MGHKTPLYQNHINAGAKIVDFAGWDMPLHYGSQLDEHHIVRQSAGMFDVSHMTIIDVQGNAAADFLRYVLANDIGRMQKPGKALYSCMLNEEGGVIDDLIVYSMPAAQYRVVVNSATREKDLNWLQKHATKFAVTLQERRDLAIVAIQGPQALAKVGQVIGKEQADVVNALEYFQGTLVDGWFMARTGYTGEDGLEIMMPAEQAPKFWDALLAVGVKPCGLGCRDTLRLEAGMNLYGADMDESTSPLESNLAWTIAWEPAERNFIGRQALEQQKQQGITKRLVGLVLEERGVLRNHQKVIVDGIGEGEVTSGSFSPSLNQAIALARVPASIGQQCLVDIRGKLVSTRVVKPPFVRHGKKAFT